MNRKATKAELEGAYVGARFAAQGVVEIHPHRHYGDVRSWWVAVAIPEASRNGRKVYRAMVARVTEVSP